MKNEIKIQVPADRSGFVQGTLVKAESGNCERCMYRSYSQEAGGIQHDCIVNGADYQYEAKVEFCSSCFFEVTIAKQEF